MAEERKQRSKLEKAEQERKLAELSEVDRLKKQLEQATAENAQAGAERDQMKIRSAFDRAAEKLGCIDVDLAFLALPNPLQLSDGKVAGLDKALAALATAKPHLFGASQSAGTGSGAGGGRVSTATKTLTPAEIRRMGTEDMAGLRKLVQSGQVKL